ncbi:MAG TPA: FGGY family carbohydrate kinase [Ruminiclostridium sp.]
MDYLMGIDIGTTAVKVLIIDKIGNIMVKSNVEYDLLLPHIGWVEQNAESMWQSVKSAVKLALNTFAGDCSEIRAISLSTQRDTLVCVNKDNYPIRNMITWMDSRSSAQCAKMERDIGTDRVYEITGVGISTIWTLAFILWLRENEPDNFQKIACFGLVHDFILCRLGAEEHYLDTSNACQTMLFDLKMGVWSSELMEYSGLSEEVLPILVQPGTKVGILSQALAAEFGMPDGIMLVSGGGDQQCASLGAGAICDGDVEIGIGTAANILATLKKPVFDEHHRLICHRAAVRDLWVLEGAMLATGKVVEWVRDTFYNGLSLKEIDRDIIENSKPGADGMVILPHFEGAACPYWNSAAKGLIFGLTLSATKANIARAFFESITFEIRKNLDILHKFGICPNKIIISGGASRSTVWMQMMADVTGFIVCIPKETDCAAVGAAVLAGVGCGLFENEKQAVQKIVSFGQEYIPNQELEYLYHKIYKKNQALYKAIDSNNLY